MKRRAPGKVRRQRRIPLPKFPREYRHVGIGKGPEAVKLISTIDDKKECINRRGDFAVVDETPPQQATAHSFTPYGKTRFCHWFWVAQRFSAAVAVWFVMRL